MKSKIVSLLVLTALFNMGLGMAADNTTSKSSEAHITDAKNDKNKENAEKDKVISAVDPSEKEKTDNKEGDKKETDKKENTKEDEDKKDDDKKDDKENGKNDTAKKENATDKKENATDKKETSALQKENLFDIDASSLRASDFMIKGVCLGQTFSEVTGHLGKAVSEKSGTVRSEFGWKDISVRFVSDLAAKYDSTLMPGVDALYVTGNSVKTARGLTVGSRRENILRLYGRPARVLWDGTKGCFYMVYLRGNQMLLFTVEKGKVKDIRITYKDDRFIEEMSKETKEADFRIAGYRLRDTFSEHSWENWLRKATNPKEEIIYYSGYGINTNIKTHRINAMFLTDSAMPTTRGLAVGDSVSTLETIYGAPDKVEINRISGVPQPAYIYFSVDEEDVLIFYINDKERIVQSVVVMPNPIGPQVARQKVGQAHTKDSTKKNSKETSDKK